MNITDESHKKLKNRINRVEGQVKGISSMIDSNKYCIDILTQTKAIRSAIKALELEILENHLNTCVKEAILSGNESKSDEKIEEIMLLLKKTSKL
ncbi:metal-sensitive transcriptional regulator [Halobacteriovorax sp. JY17]|uniref:metal-sensitive transcriptional regulator n=1 Tax=Halobacteriovorax sp. JY17 TaxID=2014617 RepID=UPI000C68D2F9|nr:metal-sensitive transcriptional regulator [Halobacteriovorax sp. JY17]PIK13666.1 MAG: transcriptional regulator [Halobacteriovorax sp. JY17]